MGIDWPVLFEGVETILSPLSATAWPIAIGGGLWGFRRPIVAQISRLFLRMTKASVLENKPG
ncbi:hypothetical protein SAMN05444678_12238 [Sphingomonas sp. YR710]|nr:hypothetical protein SAMN05444678_12238 [Sphingomonas sp. YR710]